ncbi:MAG TPA: phenylacetate--CoA ligase family protein [Burkholderiaceae bacterium]
MRRRGDPTLAEVSATAAECASFVGCLADIWLATFAGPELIERRTQRRLRALVAVARERSAFYRDLYSGLPPDGFTLEQMPVVTKAALMADFDRWVTRPELGRETVESFVRDPSRIGEPLLGRYTVWTSSGSSGEKGIFVQDPVSLAVYEALFTSRAGADARRMLGAIAKGQPSAFAAATEGHFAGITMWTRMQRLQPLLSARSCSVSVLQPVERIVSRLAQASPAVLTSYPTELVLLAREQRAGRLDLDLTGIWSGGESLAEHDRAEIAAAFGCPVIDDYGASEFLNIAFDCGCGALHLNQDWVILEAVDRDYRPVAPGEPSWTVLLTNLANHVQPIIRYDLGDSVTFAEQPCPCGSPLPALHVGGRRDDTVTLAAGDGRLLCVPPLAVTTVIEERADVYRFQLVETAINRFALRLDAAEGEWHAAGERAAQAWRRYCAELGADAVSIERDPVPPQVNPSNGKLRRVLVES